MWSSVEDSGGTAHSDSRLTNGGRYDQKAAGDASAERQMKTSKGRKGTNMEEHEGQRTSVVQNSKVRRQGEVRCTQGRLRSPAFYESSQQEGH